MTFVFNRNEMSDESFANFVIHQDNIPTPVASTPLKLDSERGTPRKYSERDSPGASLPVQPEKKLSSEKPPAESASLPVQSQTKSSSMELSPKERELMKKKGMPDWGFILFDSLTSRLSMVKEETSVSIEKVSSSISTLETSLKETVEIKCKEVKEECMSEIERVQDQVSDIAESVRNANFQVSMMREAIWDCIDQQAKSDMFSRKHNLLFAGFKEDKDETESDLLEKVRGQLGQMDVEGFPNLKDAPIVNIHRNGVYKRGQTRPRDVIVKFRDIKHKGAALRGKMKCSKNIYINLDLPKPMSAVHRQLKPILRTLEGTPYKEKGRVILKPDCIIVDNKRYTLYTIMELPSNFMFWSSNVRSNETVFAWHGNMCPFSNFFWAPIIIAGILYLFCEQYIAAERAILFDDQESLKKILMSRDPYECKKYGHLIKGFDQEEWDAKAPEVANTCIRAKVNQHKFIKDFLMSTGDKKLAEADKDSKWACGISLDDKKLLDFDAWKRIGHAGKVLMNIRDELKPKPFSFWNTNAPAHGDNLNVSGL